MNALPGSANNSVLKEESIWTLQTIRKENKSILKRDTSLYKPIEYGKLRIFT